MFFCIKLGKTENIKDSFINNISKNIIDIDVLKIYSRKANMILVNIIAKIRCV